MKANAFLYKESIRYIPFSGLSNFTGFTQMKLSILKKATLILNYSDHKKYIALFKRFIKASSEDKKASLTQLKGIVKIRPAFIN